MSTDRLARETATAAPDEYPDLGVRFVPQPLSLTDLLVDHTCLIRPIGEDEVTTSAGTDEATIVDVITVYSDDEGGGPRWRSISAQPLFWKVVRQQLRDLSNAEFPWVAGRVVIRGKGRAKSWYELAPLSPAEMQRCGKAMIAYNAAKAGTAAQALAGQGRTVTKSDRPAPSGQQRA